MTTDTPTSQPVLMNLAPIPEGERVKPKEVHFASPVAGGSYHGARPRGNTTQSYSKRRLTVDRLGEYAYKKTPSSTLMSSLQLGLQHSIGSIEPKPRRDILMTDFEVVETADFPATGSGSTPGHKFKDFTFKTYSPVAFRFFREAFGILAEDFLIAMCDRPLREVSNPGASGSLFYLSPDDAFIIKTVQKKEAHFLQKLLPGYYLNLTQNKRTLLPKFFGLYRYKSGSVNIRIVVMNNLLPSSVQYHEKYDLKGSSYKRKAGPNEVTKKSPTFKDLDFVERHEEGIALSPEKYEALLKSVERDCKVLESFGIMDYSLLLGVHNIDHAQRELAQSSAATGTDMTDDSIVDAPVPSRIGLSKNYSIVSTENIPLTVDGAEESATQRLLHYPEGFIQGRIRGDRVLMYLGVIDILQSYKLKKKLEHTMKSIITDGNTVSVHNPSYYARRFQDFITTQVFKKEKMKFRTRRNSTNVQLRGRKPGGSVRGAGGPKALEHQNSKDDPSPQQQDLPTYTEATRSDQPTTSSGATSNEPNVDPVPSGTDLSATPTLNVYTSTLATIESLESGTGSSEAKVTIEGDSTVVVSHDQPAGDVAIVTKQAVTENRVADHPNESSDFARDVRCGTSTPIDDSPKVESTKGQTFSSNVEDATTVTVGTGGVEISIVHDDTGGPEVVTDIV